MLSLSARLRFPTAQFAYRQDPRFSYCLHLPADILASADPIKLLVTVHGSGRSSMAYRDAFAGFADIQRYVVLAPLFPVGVLADDNADGYKYIKEGDLRYDELLLGMVAEVEQVLGRSFERFSLFGFSGGGHFAHRFYYLQPERLDAVSVGAPGGVTLLDDTRDFWIGTRDFELRFGKPIDLAAMRKVRSQLIVGDRDTEPFVYPPQYAQHGAALDSLGRNRIERNATLYKNWRDHGLTTERTVVPGVGHEGLKVVGAVQDFLVRS